jgi:predicted DNA-binding protein with PD1-like motif
MTVSTSSARHLLLRFTQPARLPDAILAALRDEVVLAGWMRASGVLSDVEVTVVDARAVAGATNAPPRKIEGPVQVIALEGSVGLAGGDVSCGFRVVLARATESGIETIAGDLVGAQIEALEVMITAFDDVTATRQLDRAGVWVLDATEGAARPTPAAAAPALPTAATSPAPPAPPPPPAPPAPQHVMPSPTQSGFAELSRAPVEQQPPPRAAAPAPAAFNATSPKPSPTFSAMNQPMPQRLARPVQLETEDDPVPEPGDTVEHFAFGRCEVVKSEGDRLHVRLGKDQRIKEIALEMLKVSSLPVDEGQTTKHWKLARKL